MAAPQDGRGATALWNDSSVYPGQKSDAFFVMNLLGAQSSHAPRPNRPTHACRAQLDITLCEPASQGVVAQAREASGVAEVRIGGLGSHLEEARDDGGQRARSHPHRVANLCLAMKRRAEAFGRSA